MFQPFFNLLRHSGLFTPHSLRWRVFKKVPRVGIRERLGFITGALRSDEEEEVPGVVVARVNLSPRFMQELIEAMEDNYSKWRTREGIKNLPEFDGESDDDYGTDEEELEP